MKIRRLSAAIAAVASGALLFSACSSPLGGEETTGETESGSVEADGPCKADLGDVTTADGDIKVANEQELFAYNGLTTDTYSVYNAAILDRMQGGFYYFGTDGTICHDDAWGAYEALSPTEIQYTLSDEATWSDGTPITYADYLLDWATQALTKDVAVSDDATEEPLFNHVSGLTLGDYVPAGPEADAADAKQFTYNYERVNADWEILVQSALPAHVVAEEIGVSTEELVEAIKDLDADVLKDAAEFWNEGWLLDKPGELPDPALTPSSGPYMFAEGGWSAGQSVTLTANPDYWGPAPATETLTFRQIASDGQIQALQNGDLDVIQPNGPVVDTITQLEALGDSVNLETGQTLIWEHLDFNFREGSVFAEDAGGLAAREAFALCVPRQKIVDDLIKPIDSTAVVMNGREVFPFQDTYEEVTAESYDGRYDEADIEAAQGKFAESGLEEGTEIRVGYLDGNPRRTDTVAAIKASCDEVGFEIVDSGSPTFFDEELGNGDYEVALFAWAGSGQITSGENIYSTPGGQNYGEYSNETVDAAWKTLTESTDPAVHTEQVKIIEKELWDTLFGLPLYAHPGVVASSSSVDNVRATATQGGVSWNADQWARAE
ncbi:ABC transporter substrate-binding protein [Myceligenerans xiligouense]|uniref:Peptide/nickel transport system substrate-binding protein n=1 Tax=Myceligenerans xiligouense TaxID=253184 RepID=A0A3N4ZNJ3_9MICO|nr:ABC transporter substrate-binding protein [Myceligenerans xiligouense]RPF22505.1 peptide/nickel transport system substrate-binding protein [Myceligenerans xiligouense]